MDEFFFQFCNFSQIYEFSDFSQKNLNQGGKDIFVKQYFISHSTANLAPLLILKKNLFFQKKISYLFEKSYYFNQILRQICYNFIFRIGLRSFCPDIRQVNVTKNASR